jgi:hypothetical protein
MRSSKAARVLSRRQHFAVIRFELGAFIIIDFHCSRWIHQLLDIGKNGH